MPNTQPNEVIQTIGQLYDLQSWDQDCTIMVGVCSRSGDHKAEAQAELDRAGIQAKVTECSYNPSERWIRFIVKYT